MSILSKSSEPERATGSRLRRRLAHHIKLYSLMVAVPLVVATTTTGCDDDEDDPSSHDDESDEDTKAGSGGSAKAGSDGSAAGAGGKGGSGDDGIYGYVRDNFVNLAASTDVPHDAPELDPKKAREFEGDPYFIGGAAVDTAGVELHQVKVSDDLKWSNGPVLDFSQYPFGEDGVSFFFSWQVDEHHVYFNYDITSRVIWDPTDFKILSNQDDSKIPLKFEGLPLEASGNRSGLKAGEQPVQMAYFWKDEDWWKFGSKSIIALYDRKTGAESKLIDVECPGLAVGTRDEEGYTYWGTWDYKGIASLSDQGAKPCLARITPKGELDEAFTTDLLDLTDGKFGKNFMYVRDGWGLYMVFDHEKTGFDFTKPAPAESDITTNPIDYWWNPNYWKVYRVDLKAKKAEPFEPLDGTMVLEYGIQRVDDRVFLMIDYAETWDSKKTAGDQWEDVAKGRIDELLPDDTVKPYSVDGDERGRWVRIR